MHVLVLGADAQGSVGIAVTKRPIDYINGKIGDPAIMRRLEQADAVIYASLPRNDADDSLDPIPASQIRARVLRRLLAGTGKPLIITSSFSVLGQRHPRRRHPACDRIRRPRDVRRRPNEKPGHTVSKRCIHRDRR